MKKNQQESGSVLLAVLFIVIACLAIIGGAYLSTTGQGLLTSRSADDDALETTAEGVLEYAYGQWKYSMSNNGVLAASDITPLISGANAPSVPANMTLENLTLVPVDGFGNPTSDGSATYVFDYKMSFVYNYLATVTLRSSGVGGLRRTTLKRKMVYTAVPPTRGMFYTEGDFELYKPAKMVIGGDVHTNGNAHVSTGSSSSNLEFLASANVSYVGSYDNNAPAGAASWNNSGTNYAPTYDNGLASQVKKVPTIESVGIGTTAEYNTTDSNPNNDGNHELIEPPVAGYTDPQAIADSRLYNTAGLLISISGPVDTTASLTASGSTYSGGNFSIKAQNGTILTAAQAATIRNAVSNSVTNWVPNLVWVPAHTVNGKTVAGAYVDQGQYVTTQKTLYDKREVTSVPISDFDLGAVVPTLNAMTTFNGIIYMYDTGASTKKAVRVTDGGVLPSGGLTIATADGLYVQGDYNTGTTTNPNLVPANASPAANASTVVPGYSTKSAALVADTIMVLSNGWSDANASSSVSSRNASNTTLNTALIGGYIPSVNGGNNGRSGFSGGMNNFPRFLEDWTGNSMTFSGAFVSLYQSQMYTGSWDTGDIYVPPTRYWYFDTLLLSRVLPGIPPSGGCVKGPLTRM